MAYLLLKKEILCSLCSDIYTEPVVLHCGHNFCSDCIKTHIVKQGPKALYHCPECKEIFKTKAPLTINTRLQSIAQNWRSVQNRHSLGETMCTYCLEYPSPALKVCLHCESSLCEKHLNVHSKSQEHSLVDVTASSQTRICSFHGEMLKFFCTDDQCLICMSCFLTGSHRGHLVQLLSVASRHKRERLQEISEHMHTELDALKRRENDLQEMVHTNEEKVEALKDEVSAVCHALLNYVQDVMTRMKADIEHQKMEILREVMHELSALQEKDESLSKEIKHVNDMCNQDDPLIVLLDKTCHKPEDKRLKMEPRAERSLINTEFDLLLVSLKLSKSFSNLRKFVTYILSSHCFHLKHQANVLLNPSTASDYLQVQPDLKSVVYNTNKSKVRPKLGQTKTSYVLGKSASRKRKLEPPRPEQFDPSHDRSASGSSLRKCKLEQPRSEQFEPWHDRSASASSSRKRKLQQPRSEQFEPCHYRSASASSSRKRKLQQPRSGQFKTSLVLSELAFSSGKHYWEVRGSKNGVKSIGVAYPSIEKDGPEAFIGYNKKSWCLTWTCSYLEVCHGSKCLQIPSLGSTMFSVGVYLDYEDGKLSFYRISPVEHLYTFAENFTEPLHAAFYVVNGWLMVNP